MLASLLFFQCNMHSCSNEGSRIMMPSMVVEKIGNQTYLHSVVCSLFFLILTVPSNLATSKVNLLCGKNNGMLRADGCAAVETSLCKTRRSPHKWKSGLFTFGGGNRRWSLETHVERRSGKNSRV